MTAPAKLLLFVAALAAASAAGGWASFFGFAAGVLIMFWLLADEA